MNTPNQSMIILFEPEDIPGLVLFWNFKESGTAFVAQQGEPYCLRSQSGPLEVVRDEGVRGEDCRWAPHYVRDAGWLA